MKSKILNNINSGFTLIEMLINMLIVSSVTITMFYMFNVINDISRDEMNESHIRNYANLILNEMIYEIAKSRSLKSVKFNNFKSKYNLVIVCAGTNSNLVKNLFPKVLLEHSYNETSISTILTHLPTKKEWLVNLLIVIF